MLIEIRPATEEDAVSLAPRMKQADKDEVMASGGYTPLEALASSIQASDPDMVWCATLDGVPEIIWGVAHISPEKGGVWLLSSDRIMDIRKRFMLESAAYIRQMHTRYPILFNAVDVRNTVSLVWLKKLGFTLGPVVMRNTYPFILITSEAHHV